MRMTPSKNNTYIKSGLIGLAALLTITTGIVGHSLSQRPAAAAFVPESCFTMDPGNVNKIVAYNVGSDPDCLANVTIPSTVGGETVQIIGSGIFYDDTVTGLTLPNTITEIESGALNQSGVSLSSLSLSTTGDLLIGSGAFGDGITGAVSIHSGGDLTYHESATGALTSLTISADGTIDIPTSTAGTVSISTLSITSGGDLSVTAGAFSGTTLGDVTVHSDTNIAISGGSFTSHIDSFTATSGQSLTLSASMYTSFGPRMAIKSVDLQAGTTLTVTSSALSRLEAMTNLSLAAQTGLLLIQNSSVCDITDLTTVTISAPAGLTVTGDGLCNMADLTTINLPGLAGNVSISGSQSFSGLGITSFALNTNGTITISDGAFIGALLLETVSLTATGDVTVTNGSFSSNVPALESLTIQTPGNVAITSSAFQSTSLKDVNISAGGDVEIRNGGLGYTEYLEQASIAAGGLLTVETAFSNAGQSGSQPATITLNGGTGLQISNGSFYDALASSVSLVSGGTTTILSSSFERLVATSLIFQSSGALVIDEGSFGRISIPHLTLPASLTTIGGGVFEYSQLQSVTLLSSPTIGGNVFCGAGIGFDMATYTYSDFSSIRYLPVYAPNGTPLASFTCPPSDPNGEGTDYAMGGYLINPAQLTVTHATAGGGTATSTTVGELSDSTPLTSYLVSENPTGDLDAYYYSGESLSVTAPGNDPDLTPAMHSLILTSGSNSAIFTYDTPSTPGGTPNPNNPHAPGVPNTGLLSVLATPAHTVLATSTVLGLLVGGAFIVRALARDDRG